MKRASDPPRAARGYPGSWRGLWHDRRGATAVIVAISVPIVLAVAGLGIDVGWWYTIKRQNQSAADAAALSPGYEVAYATGNELLAAKTVAATIRAAR
jgi:Flp pilus assembly protein TadG